MGETNNNAQGHSSRITPSSVSADPATLYVPADLMPRVTEIVLESGVITYDALFLALVEDSGAIIITTDTKRLDVLEGANGPMSLHNAVDPVRLAADYFKLRSEAA